MFRMLKKELSSKNWTFRVIVGLSLFWAILGEATAQIQVSRQGFPFCEPFTSTAYNADVVKGINSDPNNWAQIRNSSLQLTDDVVGHYTIPNTSPPISVDGKFGYVFLDVPFSSEYGVKASFEYFMYGGSGADGFSFFLFDGDIGESDFRVGWPGGSLGYAQIDVPGKSYPGLKGGYIGIGFDNFMNWGSYWQGKEGGFNDPDYSQKNELNPGDSLRHFNSIAIRGPESSKYKFITGKRVNDGPDTDSASMNLDPKYYLYPNLLDKGKRFDLSSGSTRVESCLLPGYRKVFFDLSPDPGNPGYYLVSVSVLVNTATGGLRVENIIDKHPYPYPAPPTLKIGFAASTGDDTNFHEIRNLAVDVAKIESLNDATAPEVEFEICEDAPYTIEFLLDESQLTDPNAFIQCINLYVDGQDGFNYATPSTWPSNRLKIDNHLVDDSNNPYCGMTPICNSCNELNQEKDTPLGTFTLDLPEFDETNNDNNRKVKIQFVPHAGVSGQQKIYYTILDNYGQVSEPGIVTATVNPYPQEVDEDNRIIDYPTCDGQADGAIRNVVISDLVPGFDYEWSWESTAGVVSDLGKSGAAVDFNAGSGQGVFTLSGVNLGVYTLHVWNPSDADGCPLIITIPVDRQLGTPVEFESEVITICEGQPASLSPFLDPQYIPNAGVAPVFRWYRNSDRTGELVDGGTFLVDGETVTIAIAADGELTLSGLPAENATTPRTYEFFVEVEAKDNLNTNGAPNFCPFEGLIETVGEITVHPALTVTESLVADWCREGAGSITISALGGNGPKTFSLFAASGSQIGSSNSTGAFPGLFPGDYYVEVVTSAPDCFYSIPAVVEGPDQELVLTEVGKTAATCGMDNGTYTFNLEGGNLPHDLARIQITGGPNSGLVQDANGEITISGLAPNANYTVSYTDEKGCSEQLNFTIDEIRKPDFSIPSVGKVCVDQGSITIGVSHNFYELQGVAVPDFNWYLTETGGSAIANGAGPNGMNYAINHSTGELGLTSLTPGVHVLYLEMGGPNSCGIPRQKVEFEIFDVPVLQIQNQADITCGGGGNGSFQIDVLNGAASDFEFSLDGSTYVDNQGAFTGMAPGVYTVRARNKNSGCGSSIEVTLTEPAQFGLTLIEEVDASCEDGNGAVKLRISGGTPAYTLTMNGAAVSGFDLGSDGVELLLENLTSGDYVFVAEDQNGCSIELQHLVKKIQVPEFAVSAPDLVCENQADLRFDVSYDFFELQGTAIPEFTWYTEELGGTAIANGGKFAGMDVAFDATSGNLVLTNLVAGTYTLYLEMAGPNSCDLPREKVDFVIADIPQLEVKDVADISCFGAADGSFTIDVLNGVAGDFEFSTDGTTYLDNQGLFVDMAPGDYQVWARNKSTGCEDSVAVTLTQPAELQLTLVESLSAFCDDGNGTLELVINGGTPGYILTMNGAALQGYDLDSDGSQLVLENLTSGDYLFSVEDSNGCITELQVSLALTPKSVFEAKGAEICELDGATGNANTAVLEPVAVELAGSSPVYSWYYKDAQGQEIEIQNGDKVMGADASITSSGVLSLTGLLGSPDPYLLYMGVTGDKVCDQELVEVEVVVNPQPEVEFDILMPSCNGGGDGRIQVAAGGEAGFVYSLSTGTSNTSGTFTGLSAGKYTVRVESASGCFTLYDLEVAQPEPLALAALNFENPSCGKPNGVISFAVTGGTPDYVVKINGQPIDGFVYQENGGQFTVTGLGPGSYSVDVADQNGCLVAPVRLFDLVNNDGFDIDSQPIQDQICEGETADLQPSITMPPTGTPMFEWFSDGGMTKPINNGADPADASLVYRLGANGRLSIDGLAPGNHQFYLKISGEGLCTQVTVADVEVFAEITAVVSTSDVSCFGNSDGVITLSDLSGGNGTYEFSLDGTAWQSDPEFAGLLEGDYTVRVRSVENSTVCAVVLPVATINAPASEITANKPDILRASCDLPNGSIENLAVTGGWGDFTFEWRKDDPATGAVMAQGSLIGLSDIYSGSYYLNVVDAGGCAQTFEFVVEESSDPEYSIVPPINGCEGTPVEIAPLHLAPDPSLPPTAYTNVFWYKGAGQVGLIEEGTDSADPAVSYQVDDTDWINPKLLVSGLKAGTYTYYFFVECTGVEIPVEVIVHPIPAPVFEADKESCSGSEDGKIRVVAGADPGLTYSVDGGSWIDQAQLEALDFAPGSYSVETRSTQGCSPEAAIVVVEGTAPLLLDLVDSKNAACGQADGWIKVSLQGGWAPYQLTLRNTTTNTSSTVVTSDSEYTFDGLDVGSYVVEVADAESCVVSLSSPVSIVDGPTEILLDDLVEICEGEQVVLAPQINPDASQKTFTWYLNAVAPANVITDGQTVAGATFAIRNDGALVVTGLTTGDYVYWVTVDGPEICAGDEKKVDVSVFPEPQFTATAEAEQCFGDGGALVISPIVAASNITYSVNGGPFIAYPDNRIAGLAPGSYTLVAKHGSGCTYSLPTALVVDGPSGPVQVDQASSFDATCGESNGGIDLSVSGGTQPYTAVVRDQNGVQVAAAVQWNGNQGQVSGLAVGTYTVQVLDSFGCSAAETGPQTISNSPTQIQIDDVQLCVGETASLTPRTPNPGLSPSYQWFFDSEGKQAIPVGTSQRGGATYDLNPATGQLEIEGLPASDTPLSFYVTATGSGVCRDGLEEVRVTVSPIPNLRTSNPSIVCDPTQTVDLTQFIEGFNPDVYEYLVTSPSGANMRLEDLRKISVSGSYRVKTKFKNGTCYTPEQRILVLISDFELIAAFDYSVEVSSGQFVVNQDVNIQEEVEFSDSSQGDVAIWHWDFGDGSTSAEENPVHTYAEKGTYEVTLSTIDQMGCQSEFKRIIQVVDDYYVQIPNAFTPSRLDGKNNFFKPFYRGVTKMEFMVFDTWGNLLFMTTDMESPGWDGRYNGADAPNGNYVYRAEFESLGGEKISKAGAFILIR